ncbi:hypothetical protein [Streptomyces sp. JHA19]|uniref:hypothetical protein n=1 Tax=Streptomyces sp. JHA19 TaxID=1577588 RepID=UPI00131AB7F2|nr:hypothetical protein [Streptomyces sp. JHA19]
MDEKIHTVAVYEIFGEPRNSVSHAVGVASPHPIDTSCFLDELAAEAKTRNSNLSELDSVSIDLSLGAIDEILKAEVVSLRSSTENSSIVEQFYEPHAPSTLDVKGHFAIGIFLETSGRPILVNLFEDGQFYVADSSESDIGWVAHEILPLLRRQGRYGE